MTNEMDNLLPAFSHVNRTRCFTHILNLIAKSMLKLFDIQKPKRKPANLKDGLSDEERELAEKEEDERALAALDEDERELLALAEDIDDEERTMRQENDVEDETQEDDDDDDGWVDEVEELTEAERLRLKNEIRPVSRVLVKVELGMIPTYLY